MPGHKLVKEGRYWYIRFSQGRRSKHYSTGETEKSRAQLVLDNFVREKLTPKDASPTEMPIDVVLRRYEDDKRGEVAGIDTYERTLAHLVEHYGDRPVSYITATTNKEYEIDRRKFGWSNATINRTRNVLRAALKHAVKDGQLRYAPHIPALKVVSGKKRWLSLNDEAPRLYRAVRGRRWRHLNLFVRIGLGTGARHEAILELTWDRVDLETGRIDFRDPDKAETKKRRPHAPINDRLLRLLRAAKKVSNCKYVVAYREKPIKSIKKGFAKACARAGLEGVTPHTLKHTYITWLLRGEATIWDVAGITNTTVGTIEKHYGHHARDDRMRALVNRSARIVPDSKSKDFKETL